MWQAPSQRSRALANQKRRERERMRQSFHVRRVRAEIKVSQPMVQSTRTDARVILNDFTPQGLGLFSEHAVMPGQEVSITLEEPKRFFVRGRVIWCQEYDANSHVLSQVSFKFRVGIEFVFETPEEQAAVEAYVTELNEKYIFGRTG